MKNMIECKPIQDILRNSIVEKSIDILRNHGINDNEIKSIMTKDFSISQEALDTLLKQKNNL